MMRRLPVILLLLWGLAACSTNPPPVPHISEAAPVRSQHIYVVDHGWHTGFVFPAAQMNRDFPFLTARFGDTQPYYEVGWGDKGFYQSHKITSGLTLQAMFWSSGSVLHIVSLPEDPAAYFPDSQVIEIHLSDSESRDLYRFIANSFARDAKGDVIKLTHGLYGDSQFYEGVGSYYILNTCNKWTAKGLQSAGFDITPALKLTANSIMDFLKEHPQ